MYIMYIIFVECMFIRLGLQYDTRAPPPAFRTFSKDMS